MENSRRKPCTVCGTYQTSCGYSYGVYVCNSCKQVFRNAQAPRRAIADCKYGNNCPRDSKNCRFCRYQYCLAAGMKSTIRNKKENSPEKDVDLPEDLTVANPSPKTSTTFHHDLQMIIRHLEAMDLCRTQTFNSQILKGDLSLDDVILTDFRDLKLAPRGPKFEPNFYDWATMDQISAINFMKQFNFVNSFSTEEKKQFVKRSYVRFIMLITGWRNMGSVKEAVEYPEGVDVFPDEVKRTTMVPKKLLEKIRCQLVAKMRELEVSKEEFLLLAGIIICDPNNMALSESSRALLTTHNMIFAKSLLQYCLVTSGPSGASRYANLLSLQGVILGNYRDFGYIWIEYLVRYQPDIRKMFSDFLSLSVT